MSREVIEGLQSQGAQEVIQYELVVTPAPVSVVSTTVTDITTGANVTATVMPTGTATIANGSIVLPLLRALTPGHQYEVVCIYSDGVSNIAPILRVTCN